MQLWMQIRPKLLPDGLNDDLYGTPHEAQKLTFDPHNTLLFQKLLRDYLNWHETNHHFYPSYPQDKQTL